MNNEVQKKLIALLLSASMAVGLLAGCGGTGGTSSTPSGSETGSGTEESSAPADNASGESSLKGKRVRVVIGSTSTGGDSYMIADMVTRYLGEEMGFNGKVDAIGNAQALDTISKAKGDGTTIMMFHDMAYLSVLFGAVGEQYSLDNLTVGPRIGINPGGCFVSHADAPYNNLSEAAQWLADNPSETITVNIESGSASHLDFVVWYMWVQEQYGDEVASRIRALVGGTTDEKKQRLWDGNADIIYADYSSCVEFTKEGVDAQLAMKLFDTCGDLEGSGVISMEEDGITFNGEPFVFDKDFFMLFPQDMDEGILNEITAAMQKVCENPDFQAELANLLYSNVTAEDADLEASRAFIENKAAIAQEIIDVAPTLDELT